MNTVHGLRKNGYEVKVRHVREFVGVKKVDDDCFMTRGEYENARLNGELAFDDFGANYYSWLFNLKPTDPDPKIPTYGNAVDSLGGWTEVLLTAPNGLTSKGKFSFRDKPFNRHIGVQAALGRALKNLQEGVLEEDKSVAVGV